MNLISDEYRQQNALLHSDTATIYGAVGKVYARLVDRLYLDFDCKSALDYGCGKGRMSQILSHIPFRNYDPALVEFAGLPTPADLLICLDVMEHIEPDYLEAVLKHTSSLMRKVGLISVCTRAAYKNLPDGRNAHLIVESSKWWLPRLMEHFKVLEFKESGNSFYIIAGPWKP
ncbi:hypothetical protein LCGC14_2368570 [marine sediment metagenome]|uniref:Methyltransferase type 11 domain-containing protein n=1 Tax=marine sediment metagenome TaxID=412755 RepID=A0A0F9C4L6_9ZZZZ